MQIHPIESLIKRYLEEKDISKGTYDLYNTILKQYRFYLMKHQIIFPKTIDVIHYIEEKRSLGYSTRWIYLQKSTLKGFYQYISLNQKRLGLPIEYAVDITESIKNERIQSLKPKLVFNVENAKQMILKTKNNRKYIWHYRDHAMVYLMLTTGLRSVEIRRARKKDLRYVHDELILYVQGKGRKSLDEYVKISKGVSDAIDLYLNQRKDKNPYLFISHSKRSNVPYLSRTFFISMFKRVLKDCELEHLKITPHVLRHAAARFNLQRGGSIEATKQLMRHRHLSSTLIYLDQSSLMEEDIENQLENYIFNEASCSNASQ